VPGTYGDFGAGIFGPSGLHFRNEFFAYHGDIAKAPIGNKLYRDVEQRVWMDSLKFSLRTDREVFGARYGAELTVPIMLYGFTDGFLRTGAVERRHHNDRTGLADLFLLPLQLNWRWLDHHLTFSQGVHIPTGSYDRDRLINLGRNYWSFDSNITYSWFPEARGYEATLNAGFLFNTRNKSTEYRSGNEFHVDLLLAHHFSDSFAVGLPGYWYKQITDDDGDVLDRFSLGSFRGEAAGVGLALLFRPRIAQRDVRIALKWLHDVHAKRRFEGSEIMLSLTFRLSP
jgi:hypothetical protein